MSYVFDIGKETAWSPSLSTGAEFVAMVERAEKSLGVESGLSTLAADWIRFDSGQANYFVATALAVDDEPAYPGALHLGVALTIAVMLRRTSLLDERLIEPLNSDYAPLLERLDRAMPGL